MSLKLIKSMSELIGGTKKILASKSRHIRNHMMSTVCVTKTATNQFRISDYVKNNYQMTECPIQGAKRVRLPVKGVKLKPKDYKIVKAPRSSFHEAQKRRQHHCLENISCQLIW